VAILKKFYQLALKYFHGIYLVDLIFVPKRRRENSCIIHVIGDSHASIFSGLDIMQDNWPIKSKNIFPPFKSYRIGATTAYNSNKKLPKIKKILNFKSSDVNKKTDYVMLCFGEIDIRVHLLKQKEIEGVDCDEIVMKCVEKYFITINKLIKWGFKVIIFGPVASATKNIIIDNYSSYGTTQERNHLTRLFNKYLENKCEKYHIHFISLFEEMVDEQDNTKADLFLDEIHLSSKALPLILGKIKKGINLI
jgi:lysophospholipase L1-like esterase